MKKVIIATILLLVLIGSLCASMSVSVMMFPAMALASLGGGSDDGSGGDVGGIDGGSVVAAAINLASHLKLNARGALNVYDINDPALQSVIKYWKDVYCGTGTICDNAQSGNLQCVAFVRGAFFLAGHPIPASGNGRDFWTAPLLGWPQIPVGQMPMPGDILSWEHNEFGHVGIVAKVDPPVNGHSGYLYVVHGNHGVNAPAVPGGPNLLNRLVLRPDLSVQSWPGYTLRGYRRPPAPYTTTMPSTGTGFDDIPADVYHDVAERNKQYIPLVAAYARGDMPKDKPSPGRLPVKFFTRQIWQESRFNPDSVSHDKYGNPLAYGIAQFLLGTAASMGVNPHDVNSSLYGAVRYMVRERNRYLSGQFRTDTSFMAQCGISRSSFAGTSFVFNEIEAFGLALVAYNAGPCTAIKTARCGLQWRSCIPYEQPRTYVRIIMRD